MLGAFGLLADSGYCANDGSGTVEVKRHAGRILASVVTGFADGVGRWAYAFAYRFEARSRASGSYVGLCFVFIFVPIDAGVASVWL